MIKVANEAGNLIIEIPESMLAFHQRAGYHKIEEPVAIPAPVLDIPPVEKPVTPEEVIVPVKTPKKAVKHVSNSR